MYITHISGNSPKTLAKGKNGQIRSQKLGKGGTTFANGQRNAYPSQGRSRGGQNPQKKGNFTNKRPPARGLRQTERFDPVSVGIDFDCQGLKFEILSGILEI